MTDEWSSTREFWQLDSMNPIHWLRSRQEASELSYWLSLVAYDRRDRSLDNRVYLVYLVVFLAIWIFITLTLFAGGMADVLQVVQATDPARVAMLLEMLLLSTWSVSRLWQAVRRSPVMFSEEDAYLLSQQPVSQRQVVLRWLLMPWLKSAVPFWLAAVLLGFGVAESAFLGRADASRIPEYMAYGLRAWAVMVPLHLALFLLTWVVGVFRLQKGYRINRGVLTVIPLLAALLQFGLAVRWFLAPAEFAYLPLLDTLTLPVRSGFQGGSLVAGGLLSAIAAASLFAILALVSGTFSLGRAAYETSEAEAISSARQYGFTDYAQKLKAQRRLGMQRRSSKLPGRPGGPGLVWKDLVQSHRSLHFSHLWDWILLFGSAVAFALLSDPGSAVLAGGGWTIQVARLCARRIRNDLEHWLLSRQLPISPHAFILYDLLSASVLALLLSWTGLGLSAWIGSMPIHPVSVLVPGLVVTIAGFVLLDLFRRSKSAQLLHGDAPGVGALGILAALVVSSAPLLGVYLLPGLAGSLVSGLVSLLLGWAAFSLAERAWRRILYPQVSGSSWSPEEPNPVDRG